MSGNVELGYAQTGHASQGRTVDTALLLIDQPTDHPGVYTPMTRGRHTNHAYVVIGDNQTSLDILTDAANREWADMPGVVRRAQLSRDVRLPTFERVESPTRADALTRILHQRASSRQRERVPLGLKM